MAVHKLKDKVKILNYLVSYILFFVYFRLLIHQLYFVCYRQFKNFSKKQTCLHWSEHISSRQSDGLARYRIVQHTPGQYSVHSTGSRKDSIRMKRSIAMRDVLSLHIFRSGGSSSLGKNLNNYKIIYCTLFIYLAWILFSCLTFSDEMVPFL